MRETWIKPNRRVILLGLIPPVLLLLLGLVLVLLLPRGGVWRIGYWVGWPLVVCASVAIGVLVNFLRLPRLGYENGELLVYLRRSAPDRVPIDMVECFFLGHGPSLMSSTEAKELATSTIVVRLAEAATEWHKIDVLPRLGHWCDGYIVIRGTWCEPINADVLQRLNNRLVAAHRERRVASASGGK